MEIALKRVYEKPEPGDGTRILVDRLWPRGLTKEKACIDIWMKDVAPSTALRKWFSHDPEKWEEFQKKYMQELQNNKTGISELRNLLLKGKVTFAYGAKDEHHNGAVVLERYLWELLRK